jgi:transposase
MKSIPPLTDDLKYLKELIKVLWEGNEQLQTENQRLKEEIVELRRRLGMGSTNSHQPPSSDGYRKKTTQPGLPKTKGQRKGGQRGHQGRTLERVANPNQVEVHLPNQGECCGRLFGTAEEYQIIQSRQVFDLPQPQLEVIEHRLGQITCCGLEQRGEYPAEVNTPVQYGTKVRARIVMLSVDCKMLLKPISQLFSDI